MLTSKQRAFLRGLANKIESTIQIGKGGIGDNTISLVRDALEKHELVKVHVLDNAFLEPWDLCNELAEMVGAEPVQVIGGKFVLYKQSVENRRIYLDKLIVKADEGQAKKNIKPGYKAKAARIKAIEEKKKRKAERKEFFRKNSGVQRHTGGMRSRKNGSSRKSYGGR